MTSYTTLIIHLELVSMILEISFQNNLIFLPDTEMLMQMRDNLLIIMLELPNSDISLIRMLDLLTTFKSVVERSS